MIAPIGRNAQHTKGTSDERRHTSLAARIAFTYSAFLLICLILGVILYASSTNNARQSFWTQRYVNFESSVVTMDGHIKTLDSYARQLLNHSTFIRFVNMKTTDEYGYYTTAYEIRRLLSDRMFIFASMPVKNCQIYLKHTDYVISGSQFTEAEQYYSLYRRFQTEQYEALMNIFLESGAEGRMIDLSLFSGIAGDLMLVRDMDAILPRSTPAIIWFEWDVERLRVLFLPEDAGEEAVLLCADGDGIRQFAFWGENAQEELINSLPDLQYDEAGVATYGDMHVMRYVSTENGWTYWLAIPERLSSIALGNYDMLFIIILLLALMGGGAVVFLMVRRNMQPIEQLGEKLQQSEGSRLKLQEEVDAQRPAVLTTYVRKLLSGHIGSDEEFAYIMHSLGLEEESMRHVVLYCVVYNQSNSLDIPDTYEAVSNALPAYLDTGYPVYFYEMSSDFYAVLASYGKNTEDPLMDLQSRVLALHDHLLMEHSLWLYAGVGRLCSQSMSLWESYEQARTAARYTARHHIFLPYEVMHKDTQSVYYPIEMSTKLMHFITSGNKAQVQEMFAVIHRENIEERTLSINRLDFLLSDLRNTLLKARFTINEAEIDPEAKALLEEIDKGLLEPLDFAQSERLALLLCPFFQKVAVPGNPVPEVEKYLRENFTDPSMCLSKLSDRFHISESYLSHLFKERTGQNFSVYLENLRLTEASRRLKEDKSCSLQTLYLELGYNNAASFRRAFKKRFGITPSAMREM